MAFYAALSSSRLSYRLFLSLKGPAMSKMMRMYSILDI